MFDRKNLWGAAAAVALGLIPQTAFAAGAYFVDDANIVDPGQTQIESWFSHSSKNENLGVADVAHQLLPNAEFTLLNSYDAQTSGNSDALSGQVKYQWLPGGEGKPISSSAVFGINSSPSDGKFSGLYAYIPSTWEIDKTFALNADLGWLYNANASQHFVTWGIGGEAHATDTLSFIGEIFDFNMGKPGGQIGSRFAVSKTLQLDLIYGRNITGSPANWVTGGMTVTF